MVDRPTREELKNKYKDFISNSLSQADTFRTNCLRFLDEHDVRDCFKHLPLNVIRKDFQEKPKAVDAEYEHLIKVFQQFEKYAASILVKEWCKDLHSIKVYTGFFKYNFEQWLSLDIVVHVFDLIGYKKTSPNILTLQEPVDKDRILKMGFELYLAHTQLHVLKCNADLTSKYSMKSIVEAWLNTTGNPVSIREWLGKNRSKTKMKFEYMEKTPSSISSIDIQEEAVRLESVTVEVHPSYFDKNGLFMSNQAVKYPPNERPDYCANSGFSSLSTINVSDNELYGDCNAVSDYTVPQPQTSGSSSNYLDATTMAPTPLAFTNQLHYEYAQNECGGEVQTALGSTRDSQEHVVARGGKSESDSSHLYGNAATFDIQARKQRVNQIFATREAQAKKSYKPNPLNRNSEPSIITSDYCMLKELHTELDREGVKLEDEYKRKGTHGKQVGLDPSFYDAATNFQGIGPFPTCNICGKLSDYGCAKCREFSCKNCFATIFQKRPCHQNENTHDFFCVSHRHEYQTSEITQNI